jgi:hypothetical protein
VPNLGRMQLRLAAPVAVLALVGATVPALGTASTRIEFADSNEVRGDLGPATGSPTAWAAKALREQAARLRIDASTFKLERIRTSLIGTHVRGRQYRGGVPISGTEVLVSAIAGRVAQVNVEATTLPGEPTTAPVGELVAKAAALGAVGVSHLLQPLTVTRLLVPRGGRLVDSYQVGVLAKHLAVRVDIDAATGRVRALVDEGRRDEGTAHAFSPNPVVTSRNTSLRQPGENGTLDAPLASPALTAQLRPLQISYHPSSTLTGDWATVEYPLGYGGPDFSYGRSDPRFVGLNAYAQVDRYQRWLQSIGVTGVNATPQTLVALTEGDDNSAYYPSLDAIIYGGGGVPDAEDGEIVLHEYGHAMQDDQMPGVSGSGQTGAMGEGFGDFNAANYYAMTSGGFGDLCIGDWDSTTYSPTNPPCLRRLDSRKRYPAGIDGEVHDDGELWSAYLWRLRSHLGSSPTERSTNAIRLVVSAQELMRPTGSFGASVAALRTAARALHHSDWAAWVDREARTTGFPLT